MHPAGKGLLVAQFSAWLNRSMSSPQASQIAQQAENGLESFFQNYFWSFVAAAVGVLGLLAWLYYADWRKSRDYRRFLDSKRRKTVRSR